MELISQIKNIGTLKFVFLKMIVLYFPPFSDHFSVIYLCLWSVSKSNRMRKLKKSKKFVLSFVFYQKHKRYFKSSHILFTTNVISWLHICAYLETFPPNYFYIFKFLLVLFGDQNSKYNFKYNSTSCSFTSLCC